MQEPPAETATVVPSPAGAPVLTQALPAWLLNSGVAALAIAVAVLLLLSVPAGL
jgi:hypothetical protein